MSGMRAPGGPADGHLSVIALDGMPEVRTGDDLAGLHPLAGPPRRLVRGAELHVRMQQVVVHAVGD